MAFTYGEYSESGDYTIKEKEVKYIEYIESDGASYIDTGIIPTTSTKLELVVDMSASKQYDHIFGTDNFMKVQQATNENYYINVYKKGSVNIITSLSFDGKHTIVMDMTDTTNSITIDGINYGTNIGTTESTNYPLLLLCGYKTGGAIETIYCGVGKIYSCKIWESDALTMNLRPCLDSEGTPCMYDEISQTYFYNQGTGTFTAGNYKLYLFADNQDAVATNLGNYRLYDMKIEDNGELLREFQPVLDNNNIPCLMDKVNRKYYYDNNGNVFNSQEEVKYRRIPYIQGDGASWLDIGQFNFDSNTRFEVKVAQPEWRSVRECIINNSGNLLITLFNNGTRLSYRVGTAYGADATGLSLGINTPHIFTITQTEITCDGNVIANPTSYGDISSTNIYLLKEWSINTEHATAISQLYCFKIYQSDELVFDGIPVLDQDNIPCMYDLVTETFFYNQGTGEFNYEIEELECPTVDILDYIDVKGNLNYDTGLTFDNTWSKIEFKFNTLNYINTGQFVKTNDVHLFVNYFSLRYNYGVLLFVSRTDETGNGNFQIGEYSGILQKNTDITLTYTPYNWNINGIDYPMEVESLDSSIGNLILFPDFSGGENRFYSYKVWDTDGNLIQSLLPAIDKDGVDCLYDEINKNILYANGEDYNKIGNTVYPKSIKYIESNGTQYIDTGVVITDNTDIDMTCRETTMIDYISDGLIFNLDGIKNTRNGHVSDTTVWEDLSGNGLDFDLNNITITDNCMSFNGSTSYANIQDIELWKTIANNTTEYDVELCFKFSRDEAYQPIISSNYSSINIAKFLNYLQFRSTTYGINLSDVSGVNYATNSKSFTISCNMNDLLGYFNTTNYTLAEATNNISSPISDNFSIGTRLTGNKYWFNGDIYSIRIYNRHLTDEERLYNHSVDVDRFDVETDIITVKTGNYIMNNLRSQDTYKYQDTDTTVQPNLTISEGATLTLGETNLAYLSEKEIEDATNDGWNLL